MADSAIALTPGAGANVDTRTEATNGNHRQVVVIGDPATNAGVAPVDATNGLTVQMVAALPAGTNAIGKLAANSGVDIGNVDVASVVAGTGATNLGKAEDAAHASGDTGVAVLAVRRDSITAGGADGDYVTLNTDANGRLYVQANGDIAHDAADSGAPLKVGHVAIAHGTNPTAVAAADRTNWYANRAGVPFVIGGHPNVICKGHIIADGDGAQTDAALIGSIGSGTKIVLTRLSVVCDNENSGNCAITIGFGATNTPSPNLAGVAGVIVNGSFDGGAGITLGDGSGIIGVGGDGEELRITCSDPAGGNIRVSYSYYTIES